VLCDALPSPLLLSGAAARPGALLVLLPVPVLLAFAAAGAATTAGARAVRSGAS
jgi:hypothetical protein